MKKKLLRALSILALCLFLNSCITISQLDAFETGTALSSSNFRYVKSVEGQASGVYIAGLFGSNNNATAAIKAMKKDAQLKENQALANVSVDESYDVVLFGIVIFTHAYATADVVEFTE